MEPTSKITNKKQDSGSPKSLVRKKHISSTSTSGISKTPSGITYLQHQNTRSNKNPVRNAMSEEKGSRPNKSPVR